MEWPGGSTETFAGIQADRRLLLIQGSGRAVELDQGKRQTSISPGVVELPSPQSTARIPKASLLPIANLEYQTLTGEKERLPGGNGRAYVLSL